MAEAKMSDLFELENDWQNHISSWEDKIKYIYTEKDLTDITLVVGCGDQKAILRANRFILAACSPVFYAMFYGPDRNLTKTEVVIPDIEPDIFEIFLNYIYLGSAIITTDSAVRLLYCADKYQVTGLQKDCFEFFKLHPANVMNSFVIKYLQCTDKNLRNEYFQIIGDHSMEILQSKEFIQMDKDDIAWLLHTDILLVDEKEIYEAALRWASAQCQTQNLEATATNMREVLKPALYSIRFPLLKTSDLLEGPGKSGLLTDAEIINIIACRKSKDKHDSTFMCNERSCMSYMSLATESVRLFEKLSEGMVAIAGVKNICQ